MWLTQKVDKNKNKKPFENKKLAWYFDNFKCKKSRTLLIWQKLYTK